MLGTRKSRIFFDHCITPLQTQELVDLFLWSGLQGHSMVCTLGSISDRPLTFHLAIAVQHICMAKALILQQELRTLYSTPSPQDIQMTEVRCRILQLSRESLIGAVQGNMTRSLSILFGIALSVDDEISLRVMACHALCACK